VKLTYKPEDGTEQSWVFRPGKLRRSVAQQLAAAYGKKWELFLADLQQGDLDARAVVLWHCMRTDHPILKFDDLPDFLVDELALDYEADELRDMLTQTESNSAGIPADQREIALAVLRSQLADAEAAEDGPGKASESSTAG
jgi:hypothetical protein